MLSAIDVLTLSAFRRDTLFIETRGEKNHVVIDKEYGPLFTRKSSFEARDAVSSILAKFGLVPLFEDAGPGKLACH